MELDNCGEKCSMLFPTQLTTQLWEVPCKSCEFFLRNYTCCWQGEKNPIPHWFL